MILDGRNGYVSGNLNQTVNTVLRMIKGPVKNKNWFNTTSNPAYSIIITSGATGAVKLQGTNDVGFRGTGVEMDFLPLETASWTDIQAATSTTVSSTFALSWEFIRLIITTQGTGYVTEAWVRWN